MMTASFKSFILLFVSLPFCVSVLQAQQPITRLDGYGGQPSITHQKYVDTKGDPFFFEDWTEAVVYAANGNQFSEVMLKFDLITSELHFFVADLDKSYLINMAIDSFSFVGQEKPHFFVKLADGKYYERLVSGDHELYKMTNKHLFENRPYGSAEVVRNIRTKTQYFYKHAEKMTPVATNRRAVLRVVDPSLHEVLQTFVRSNDVNLSTEDGLVRTFNFLNQTDSSF